MTSCNLRMLSKGGAYGSDIPISFQFQLNGVIQGLNVHPLSLKNRTTIYNQNQRPNLTGNISLTLDSKRRLVVLALRILLSNKKSLEIAYMSKMELGIRNWNSLTGFLIVFFNVPKFAEEIRNRNWNVRLQVR